MINCQSHQDLNNQHKTKHRKVLLWGNTLVSVIINQYGIPYQHSINILANVEFDNHILYSGQEVFLPTSANLKS